MRNHLSNASLISHHFLRKQRGWEEKPRDHKWGRKSHLICCNFKRRRRRQGTNVWLHQRSHGRTHTHTLPFALLTQFYIARFVCVGQTDNVSWQLTCWHGSPLGQLACVQSTNVKTLLCVSCWCTERTGDFLAFQSHSGEHEKLCLHARRGALQRGKPVDKANLVRTLSKVIG